MPQQPVLSEKDRHQLLYQFNDTKAEYPRDKVLHELFEEQVEKTPDNLAVIFKDTKLTYRELNERSNQLARRLRERGVRPDQIVGLMVNDNSIEMIIGMISILKAGGAFLPIDPDFPKERIEYMIEDSNIAVLLTQGKLRDEIRFEGEVINLDNQSSFTGDYSNLEKINQSSDLAYVIYTSGSTGRPKGVQIEHTSIVNQIFGLEKTYTFDSSLHHILLAPITFDPSVQQIFLPLTSGGKLFLVPKSTKHNLKELWEFIVSNRIDIVNTVPSLMNVLLDHVDGYDGLHFKYIILAGELFSKNLYLRLKESLFAEKIINIYGPTEATINTTLYECKLEEVNGTIPIGKPLMNYNVLILDKRQNLLPIGVPGEICISGVGLARGYLNNAELTSEKFVANPFTPGERMYRTGDLGRWTADGNIEFLGRIDHQVKVRGIRVELGEVETSLAQHPGVKETVVIDQEGHAGNTRLVAYVVPNQEQILTIDELRLFLKEKLPGYMVPSAFVIMDALPLTPHGKVDRRALPAPELGRQEPEDTFVPPRDQLEYQLTIIWEKVLGIKPIGVRDEFFKLGGTSLLAMVLFAQVEKKLGQRLPLATIIDAPTVEKLARILAKGEWSAFWSPLVAIQPEGSEPPFFCVHGHRGNVIGFHNLARYLGMEQPFYGLQAQGLDGKPVSDRRIPDMATNYVKEIRTVQPEGPYFLGGWCMGGLLAFEMAHLLQEKGEKVALVAMIDCNHPNNPEFLPNSTLLRRLIYSVIGRIDYEISFLRALGTKGKLSYISTKIKTVMTVTQVKIEKVIESFLVKFHLSIPHSWAYKLNALHEAHVKAIVSYEPRPYQGRVAIFRASKQPLGIYPDPTLGWSELIRGELELHEIAGHYLNIFLEPSVQVLAKKLKTCIGEAKQMI
jgi:amino acid adenylation domain-containing protein